MATRWTSTEFTTVYKQREDTASQILLHHLTINHLFLINNTNHTLPFTRCIVKMQFTTIITALSFSLGAHAWAQAGNGEWIANDTKYYGFENARKSTLNQGLQVMLKQSN